MQAAEPWLSLADYYVGENDGQQRHEYVAGRVYAMTGASRAHNRITLGLAAMLLPAARRKGCEVFIIDMKVQIAAADAVYYPDIVVSRDTEDQHDYFLEHPCLIAEVLSPSTQRIDRREKWLAYQQLASLNQYLLIDPEQPRTERFRRQDGRWQQAMLGPDDELSLPCLQLSLPVASLYAPG